MQRQNIKIEEFKANVFTILDKEWMLLTAGNMDKSNCMTISWGAMGTMWNKPLVIVGVRPQRYTFEFMESAEDFTISAFSPDYKDKLLLCGTKSGRDIDKVNECNFSLIPSKKISSPGFDDAQLIIECRKLFSNDIIESGFCETSIIDVQYPSKDYHRMFYAEVVNIEGVDRYKV